MNRIKLPILIAFLMLGLSAECQVSRSDTLKLLCQNWKFESISHEPESKELLEDWNEWKNNVRFNFFPNNIFKEIFDDEAMAGKWDYDSDKKRIILKTEDENFWHLKSISPLKLVVEFLTILDDKKMVTAILTPVKQ